MILSHKNYDTLIKKKWPDAIKEINSYLTTKTKIIYASLWSISTQQSPCKIKRKGEKENDASPTS